MTSPSAYAELFGEDGARIDAALDVESFNQASVYNVPGYHPIGKEMTQVPVRVTGNIPEDLNGVYIRNGTNMQFPESSVRMHPFNGAGMLHQIQIEDGAATYSNSYIRTPRFEYEDRIGREVFVVFSDVATAGPIALQKAKLVEDRKSRGLIPALSALETSTGSTAIQYHAGHLYCLQESGYAFRLHHRWDGGRLMLDGSGHLETWDGAWKGPFSAHPRIDPDSGDVFSIGNDRGSNQILLGHLSNGGLVNICAVHRQDAQTNTVAWIHDYFLTENYIIFPDISMRYSAAALQEGSPSAFRFDEKYNMRFGLIPRDAKPGDAVRWFETGAPGVIWHVVNGWEEQDDLSGEPRILLFSPKFDSYPTDIPIHTPEEPPAHLTKWVLDLNTGKVVEERVLLEHGYERPSLNLCHVGKPSRYAYLLDEERAGYMGKGVLKYDMLAEREIAYLDYGEFYGGEALFVPREGGTDEDDGYLIDLLMSDSGAELLIADARDMTVRARLSLPQRVPFGVHACWLGDRQLQQLRETAGSTG